MTTDRSLVRLALGELPERLHEITGDSSVWTGEFQRDLSPEGRDGARMRGL